MNFAISLIDLSKEPHFVVPKDGTYLVKTISSETKRVSYFSCHVTKELDKKRNIYKNKYGCHNQTVVGVSTMPLSLK